MCRSPVRAAPATDGRASATISTTISSTGTTATLAAIASSSSEMGRRSAIRPPLRLRDVDVQAQREHRHVEAQRRHAEAHEGKRYAGER